MGNKVKDMNIKNTNEKSYKNILIYNTGYITIKDLKYIKINSLNPLYLIFNKLNDYFEQTNGNKYLTLIPANESKEKIKKYEELWSKIRDLIRSITKNSDDYDKKYVKTKFNLYEDYL